LIDEYSKPVLATPDIELFHIGPKGCSCLFTGCQKMTEEKKWINQMLIRAQWERRSRAISHTPLEEWPKLPITRNFPRSAHYQEYQAQKLYAKLFPDASTNAGPAPHSKNHRSPHPHGIHRNHTIIDTVNLKNNVTSGHVIALSWMKIVEIMQFIDDHCVFISPLRLEELKKLMEYFHANLLCPKYGCGYIPSLIEFPVFTKDDFGQDQLDNNEKICIPVFFDQNLPRRLLKMLTLLRMYPIPPSTSTLNEGQLVKTKGSKAVYLFQNSSLHTFPNGDTFMAMGFSFDKIMEISPQLLKILRKGSPLPELSPPTTTENGNVGDNNGSKRKHRPMGAKKAQ
jgi:hypothetical protein